MADESTEETFMEEVQQYPCLCDKFNKEFQNKLTRVSSWEKVAEKFNISWEEVQQHKNRLLDAT